ncbi:MAG: hypothetical protein NTX66_04285 [Candidatus Falkowbacteria bacterium]|nr:hypothetical protein [Candidatus Falkowbacteria bacterium]
MIDPEDDYLSDLLADDLAIIFADLAMPVDIFINHPATIDLRLELAYSLLDDDD